MNIIKRFWKYVDKRGPDDCWEWLGHIKKDGYGCLFVKGKPQQAHRISWAIAHRTWPIPAKAEICHTCDNTICVNPAHLYLGTHTTNMQDRSPLAPGDVKLIRWLYKSGDYTQEHIGRMFRVASSTITHICNNRSWKNV